MAMPLASLCLGQRMAGSAGVTASDTPPGPRSMLGVREAWAFRSEPLSYLRDLARNYGDVAHFQLGWRHAYLLNHPSLVHEFLVVHAAKQQRGPVMQRGRTVMGNGLLTSEEPLHAQQRKLIQPVFHREPVARYASIMSDCARRTCERWRNGEIFDLHKEMMRLTLAILGRCLFGREIEEDASDIGQAVTELMSLVELVFVPFSGPLMHLFVPGLRRLRKVRERLDRLIYRLIEERRNGGVQGDDLLALLLRHQMASNHTNAIRQVRDECLTILLAGHETIANSLTYTLYLLAQNTAEMERIRHEANQVARGKDLTAVDYDSMPIVRANLAESMRLYPPVWVLARSITEPCKIGNYTLPGGAILFVSQYLLHRDSRFFANPDRFSPERFLRGGKTHPSVYFPFGLGPRRCIGEGFALMEGALVLSTILQRWNVVPLPETRLVVDPKITLRPKLPVLVKVVPVATAASSNREKLCEETTSRQAATG